MSRLTSTWMLALTALFPTVVRGQRAPAPASVEAHNRMRASELGIHLSPKLERVMLPDGATTGNDIRRMAQESRANLADVLSTTRKTRTWLGLGLGVGTVVVEVGQYAGGAGAGIFGLQAASGTPTSSSQTAGRNAAYAGAVAFAVTLLKDVLHLDAKKKAVTACANLAGSQFGLKQATYAWEGQADDPTYEASFLSPNGPYDQFNETVDGFVKDCLASTT